MKSVEKRSMTDKFWNETETRVLYRDTDRMGVVYYGNYFAFFEMARASLLRELGFPYSRMEKEGYSLVVVEASARYMGNVGYDDVIRLRSTISEMKRVQLRFDYQAMNAKDELLVTGHTVHACMGSNGSPVRFPSEFKSLVERSFGV